MSENSLSADPTDRHPIRLRGHNDVLSASSGIVGWAVDLDAPTQKLRLQLVAGNRVLAETETVEFREDLASLEGVAATPGFRFPPRSLLAILETAPADLPERLLVRVANTPYTLSGATTLYAREVFSIAEQVAEASSSAIVNPIDFHIALEERRNLGRVFLRRPFNPRTASEVGFVEVVCPITSDMLLVIGWTGRSIDVDLSGVIIAGEKYPFGLSGFTFRRPDLVGDAVGFIALAKTSWRPTSGSSFIMFWENGQQFYLRGHDGLRILEPREARKWLDEVQSNASASDIAAMRYNLSLIDMWHADLIDNNASGIRHGIDRALVVPGFGVLLDGWMISPWKRIESLTLRIGNQILPSDSRALITRSRADLSTPFPDAADLLDHSGFSALFFGHMDSKAAGPTSVRVRFDDGSAALIPIEPRAMRTCNSRAGLEAALRQRPSLPYEHFFHRFIKGYGGSVRSQAAHVRLVDTGQCSKAVIVTLSSNDDDTLLLFEAIRRDSNRLPDDVGIVILATRGQNRQSLLRAVDGLRSHVARSVHLVEIWDGKYSLWSLEAVVKALRCDFFWFLGPGALPLEQGWQSASAWFSNPSDERLTTFVSEGRDDARDAEPDDGLSFAWSTIAFGAWQADAPFFPGGFYRDNGLPAQPNETSAGHAVAWLDPQSSSKLVQVSDRRCYEAFERDGRVS